MLVPFNQIHRLLSDAEIKRIREIGCSGGGDATREAIGWCVRDVEEEYEAGRLHIVDKVKLRDEILSLRGKIGTLYDYKGLPMPFFYSHLITIISGIYLTLFSCGMAVNVEQCPSSNAASRLVCHITGFVIGSLAIAAAGLSIVGLQQAAYQLAFPFGDDLVDFTVLSWITRTLEATRRVVSRPYRPDFSSKLEQQLEKEAEAQMKEAESTDKRLYHIAEEKFLRAKNTKAPGFTTRAERNAEEAK